MSSVDHLLENASLVSVPPLSDSAIRSLFREAPE